MTMIKSKADFKRRVKDVYQNGKLIKTYLKDRNGKLLLDNAPTTIAKLQTNGFALLRGEKHSWFFYNQQDEIWIFGDDEITIELKNLKQYYTLKFIE